MGWKKFFVGEPMPDKDDPKYAKRRERDMAAGAKFARWTGLTWIGQKICGWAMAHKELYITIALGIILLCSGTVFYRLYLVATYDPKGVVPVTQQIDSLLQNRYHQYENNH